MGHFCNHSAWDNAGGLPVVEDQLGLSETLSQNQKQNSSDTQSQWITVITIKSNALGYTGFDPGDPHDGKRELTPTSCPLTSTHALCQAQGLPYK